MGRLVPEAPTQPEMVLYGGPIEIGLRALIILSEAFPALYSLQRLVIFDYLIVHSDDVDGGPPSLHPKTPYRGGELLVRRRVLQSGLLLYQSRGLVEELYENEGVFFAATDNSGAFLDSFRMDYVQDLKQRAKWLVTSFAQLADRELEELVRARIGQWGAEYEYESVLWLESKT